MTTKIIRRNGKGRSLLSTSDTPLITDVQSAAGLDGERFNIETDSTCIALKKDAVAEAFFILSTRLAGGVLQKFVNYNVKLAIIGDYSRYTSKR